MDAFSKQLHLRGRVYEVRFQGEPAYMLPLIERVRERGFVAHVEAVFVGPDAMAWVELHREALRAGTTLNDLQLLDIRAKDPRDNLLTAVVRTPPTIAPPRQAGASLSPSPQAEQA